MNGNIPILKINRFDAHDRFQHITKQDFDIGACCQDLINQRPFGNQPFYIFAHPRTDEDGVTKRMIWQPRLTKPKAQTNSMLFKAYPGTDNVKVIWILPARELWDTYKMGNVTENKTVLESIDNFNNHRHILEAPEKDDLPDDKIDEIYRNIARGIKAKKIAKRAMNATTPQTTSDNT